MPDETTNTKDAMEALIRAVAEGAEKRAIASRLLAGGWPAGPGLVDSLAAIVSRLGASPDSWGRLAVVFLELLASPDPEGAFTNFLRFIEASGASAAFLDAAAGGKPLREILAVLFGASQYMADIVTRNPGYLYWLIESRTWDREDSASVYEENLRSDISNFRTVESRLDAVRRFQRRMLLKIGAKDLLGAHTVERTTLLLSHLADATARVVLDVLWPEPSAPARAPGRGLAVLALGKLGGNELNYSSDVDLLYICDDVDEPGFEFYHRLARRLTNALSEITPEGYLYRVDLRLRPDGETGPLVNSLDSLRVYYENRGRPWEFQALLKARVIAGDTSIGEKFLGHIAGLVFNPALTYSPVEAIDHMRYRIREAISARERSFNIKLMEGGIRDIEFIVQTLQLMHGAKHLELRTPNTLTGLRRAHEAGLLSRVEHDTLAGAYRFFRLVEHRLQMMHQIKTHSIPKSPDEVRLLARRVSRGPLGRYSYENFLSTLAMHVTKARVLSDSFFAGEKLTDTSMLLLLPADDGLAREILGKYRIADPPRAVSILQSLAHGTFPSLVDRKTRSSFQNVLPLLLEDLGRTGDPDRTLVNFSRITAAVKNVSPFYDLLRDSAVARTFIGNLAGISSVMTSKFCGNTEILDSLLEDPGSVLSAPLSEAAAWENGVATPSAWEILQRELRNAADRKLLAAWFCDLRDRSLPDVLCRTVTATSRELVCNAFDVLVGDTEGVALFALGSLATSEPRLESDVDLLVITKARDIEDVTRRIQTLGRMLSEANLVRADFRLRGEGQNAPLVQDIETYRTYFRTRLSPWERVAFAKHAFWRGDAELAREFTDELAPYVTRQMETGELEKLRDVRRRLERLVTGPGEILETKRSAGGRYDIEYILAVGLSSSNIAYPFDASTPKRLETMASLGLLGDEELALLLRAERLHLAVEYLLELEGITIPPRAEAVQVLTAYLDRTWPLVCVPVQDTERTLSETKAGVRACYERVVGK